MNRILLASASAFAIAAAHTESGCATASNDNRTIVIIGTTDGAGGAAASTSSGCGAGGGGGTATCPSGTGGHAECGCTLDADMTPECHREHATLDGVCSFEVVADGLPCRAGVGLCSGGVCIVDPGPGCSPFFSAGPWPWCSSDGECDDGNACTLDSCPALGCGPCLHVPVPAGKWCGAGLACNGQGSCCAVDA